MNRIKIKKKSKVGGPIRGARNQTRYGGGGCGEAWGSSNFMFTKINFSKKRNLAFHTDIKSISGGNS